MLSEKEKQEMLEAARSKSLRKDMRHLVAGRRRPLFHEKKVDLDKLIEFLNECNAFINHRPKPFEPMIEKIMKL